MLPDGDRESAGPRGSCAGSADLTLFAYDGGVQTGANVVGRVEFALLAARKHTPGDTDGVKPET